MAYRRDSSNLYGAPDAYETEREGQMSKVSLFGIAIIVMLRYCGNGQLKSFRG
jgi:hypothetical protein